MLIVHTSDMHGRLTPQKAKKLLHLKERGAILLDSGDALAAGNLDFRWREKVLSLMNLAGYTAGAVGNREFHPFPSLFKWKLKDASFPHLSANIIPNLRIRTIRPYIILEEDGYHIAIIGLTLPQVRGFWQNILPLRFSEPISCGRKLGEKLGGECDFLIFLSHMGIEMDLDLAKELNIPSLILGGHNHISLQEPLRAHKCYVMHSGSYAQAFGLIEMEKGRINGSLESL